MAGIDRPRAARSANAHAAHALDAAADGEVMLTRHHLRGGEIHRIEARSAKAIDLHAGNRIAITGSDRAGARDVSACLPDGIDAAEHDVVDFRSFESVTVLDGFQRCDGKTERRHLMQRPSALPRPRGVRTAS